MEDDELGDVDVARSLEFAELFLYPGDGHLFTDSSLPAYDADATALVLERVSRIRARKARPVGAMRRELIVELRSGADAAAVERWLRQRGLEVLPMTVGLLASGEEAAVRNAQTVADELRAHVKSVSVAGPKRLQN